MTVRTDKFTLCYLFNDSFDAGAFLYQMSNGVILAIFRLQVVKIHST